MRSDEERRLAAQGAPVTFAVPALEGSADAAPSAVSVVERTASDLPLNADQRTCLADRLSKDEQVLAELGEDPARSASWGAVLEYASECINAVTYSGAFTAALQGQAGGALTDEQLGCVRTAVAGWSADDLASATKAGLRPSQQNAAGVPVERVLAGCGIDRSPLRRIEPPWV